MQQKEESTGGQSVRTPFVLIAIVAVVSLVGAVWYLQSRKSAEPEAGAVSNPLASQEEEPVLVASGTNILNRPGGTCQWGIGYPIENSPGRS